MTDLPVTSSVILYAGYAACSCDKRVSMAARLSRVTTLGSANAVSMTHLSPPFRQVGMDRWAIWVNVGDRARGSCSCALSCIRCSFDAELGASAERYSTCARNDELHTKSCSAMDGHGRGRFEDRDCVICIGDRQECRGRREEPSGQCRFKLTSALPAASRCVNHAVAITTTFHPRNHYHICTVYVLVDGWRKGRDSSVEY